MTEDQYLSLCEKYLKGDCTPEEEILIEKYQNDMDLTGATISDLYIDDKDRLKNILYKNIQASLKQHNTPVIKMHRWPYAAAAAILVLVSVGIYFAGSKKHKTDAINSPVKSSIKPGSNKAILTLANGHTITLDDAPNGVLSKQGNTAISKSANGIAVKGGLAGNNNLNTALNTIAIPRGGKYNITLPDGTKVWLNSSSALTFPTEFTGTERKVTLMGEAYFEVAKNAKMPFKINVSNKQVVEVLGTHFNISAYADDNNITTTLLEGSVKINYKNKETLIKPGQMAINAMGEDMDVKLADIDDVMAWRNEMFRFNNENIVSVMKKVSRWYDVDVMFKGDMSKIDFYGNYSRVKSLENLLKNIEKMDKVHFTIDGRRITVIGN